MYFVNEEFYRGSLVYWIQISERTISSFFFIWILAAMFERDMDTIIVSIAFIDNLFIEKDCIECILNLRQYKCYQMQDLRYSNAK